MFDLVISADFIFLLAGGVKSSSSSSFSGCSIGATCTGCSLCTEDCSSLLFSFLSFFLAFDFWFFKRCCSCVRFFFVLFIVVFVLDSLKELLLLFENELSITLSLVLFELLSKLYSWLKFNLTGCISSSSVFNENGLVGIIPVEVKGCKSFWLGDSPECIPNSVFNDNGTVGLIT